MATVLRRLATSAFQYFGYGYFSRRDFLGQSLDIHPSRWVFSYADSLWNPQPSGLHLLSHEFGLQRLVLANRLLHLRRKLLSLLDLLHSFIAPLKDGRINLAFVSECPAHSGGTSACQLAPDTFELGQHLGCVLGLLTTTNQD
ncbi:hypothetical protein SDC9_200513 [bioreactor metagenome]|uniref:Uncharacterized protein n=1 Tax=bioreactor metagenome TaxID=1076179 RepID=A0A645IP14_9ZZZZ